MTGHFINYPQRTQVILAAIPLISNHTGEYIVEILEAELNKWDTPIEKFHLFLRDNAPNMECAMRRRSDWRSFPCFNHTCALVIKSELQVQTEVRDLLSSCRSVVGHFHHSSVAVQKLRDLQEELHLPIHHLKQESVTRWNSTVDMLERLIEQREAIALYAIRVGGIRADLDWLVAEQLVKLLNPFREAINQAQEKDACISLVIPLIVMLERFLNQERSDWELIRETWDTLRSELKRRFSNIFQSKFLVIATLLDPRFKNKFFTKAQLTQAQQWIRREIPSLDEDSEPVAKQRLYGIILTQGG